MAGIVRYLEIELNLPVNREKSRVAAVKDVPFLGFQILRGKIRVSNKARTKFKDKVRELTRRNTAATIRYRCIRSSKSSTAILEVGFPTLGFKRFGSYLATLMAGYEAG